MRDDQPLHAAGADRRSRPEHDRNDGAREPVKRRMALKIIGLDTETTVVITRGSSPSARCWRG
jgi:hypothetical protein